MTEAATQPKKESDVSSSEPKPKSTETKSAGAAAVPASVPSSVATTKAATTTTSPKTPTGASVRRVSAPPAGATPPTLITGSSRAAKSKKKKGGAGGVGPGENTGRWTAEEHRLFLQGLEQHGKGWKKIASLIKSRTVVQIRTHAQKYFQKLAKARQNGDEGEISMEGRGGISTITSTVIPTSAQSPKRRRQQTGTKRKAIHSVVSAAQREGKKIALEQEKAGVPNPVPPLPAVSPVLAHFVLPESGQGANANNKSSLGSSTSGPALEDSIFRFLTPTPTEPPLNDVARQAGANPITLPTDQPSAAPTGGGEISPTGVADLSLYPSWTDGKDPPSWYAKGADVEALLDVADGLDWLVDPGDSEAVYQQAEAGAAVATKTEKLGAAEAQVENVSNAIAKGQGSAEAPNMEDLVEDLPAVENDVELPGVGENAEAVDQQLPSIFDGAPESTEHLPPEATKGISAAESAVHLGDAVTHPPIDEPLFDTPMEEHDFVSTILENESSANLPALHTASD